MLDLVMPIVGAVILILGWRDFRAAKAAGDITLSYGFMLAAVILPSATTATAAFTGGQVIGQSATFERTVTYVGLSAQVNSIATPVLVLVSVVTVMAGMRRPGGLHRGSTLGLLAIVLLTFGAIAQWGPNPLLTGGRIALIVLLAAAIFVAPGHAALVGAAHGLVVLAGLSAVAVAFAPDSTVAECDIRKCGLIGGIVLQGVADNPNGLGLLMALGLPVVYFGVRVHPGWLAMAVALLVAMSGSRTASVAVMITGLVLFLRSNFSQGSPARSYVPGFAALAGLGLMIALPMLNLPSTTFTNRAGLWAYALHRWWNESPWIGFGPELWRTLPGTARAIPRSAGYATHNQVVEVLFVAGLLGAATAAAFVIVLIHRGGGAERGMVPALLIPVAVLGTTERPWSLGQVDYLSWSLLIIILAVPGIRERRARSQIEVRPGRASQSSLDGGA